MPQKNLKVELHQHTQFSPDSTINYSDLLKAYENNLFDVVAITDHDSIEGAQKCKEKNNFPVIVGEEITTRQGDLVGLFLKEAIRPGYSALETAQRIKDQEGLVHVPHPFNPLKRGLRSKTLQQISEYIDTYEVINGTGRWGAAPKRIKRYFSGKGYVPVSASDAHFPNQIGCSVMHVKKSLLGSITPENLRNALQKGMISNRTCPFFFHLCQSIPVHFRRKILQLKTSRSFDGS